MAAVDPAVVAATDQMLAECTTALDAMLRTYMEVAERTGRMSAQVNLAIAAHERADRDRDDLVFGMLAVAVARLAEHACPSPLDGEIYDRPDDEGSAPGTPASGFAVGARPGRTYSDTNPAPTTEV
jgi:hypothetical protein